MITPKKFKKKKKTKQKWDVSKEVKRIKQTENYNTHKFSQRQEIDISTNRKKLSLPSSAMTTPIAPAAWAINTLFNKGILPRSTNTTRPFNWLAFNSLPPWAWFGIAYFYIHTTTIYLRYGNIKHQKREMREMKERSEIWETLTHKKATANKK